MSTRYLEILAHQRPFCYGVDDNQRALFSCNFVARAADAVPTLERDIARLVIDAGLGTLGTDLFLAPMATMPSGNGPQILIKDTGGLGPEETHDGARYEQCTFQVVVRGKPYSVARDRALAVYGVLHGKRDVNVTAA